MGLSKSAPIVKFTEKTEAALKKHIYRLHRLKKKSDEERNDWEKIKDKARAATNDNKHLTQKTLECPPRHHQPFQYGGQHLARI